MIKVLYQIPELGPGTGGIAPICRYFTVRMPEIIHENEYWARQNNEELWHRLVSVEDGVNITRIINKEQSPSCIDPAKSSLKTFYNDALIMFPVRMLWRSAMGVKHYLDQKKKIQEYENYKPIEGAAVIHAPFQWIWPPPPYNCKSIPYIMNLHDLQHEYFPGFFTERELSFRRRLYYESARASRFVVAAARHVQDDIVKYVGVPKEKVPMIPWGAPFDGESMPAEQQIISTIKKYNLPKRFIIYPAVTWEHKNHIRLLKALLLLRKKSVFLELVLTGGAGPYHDQVLAFIDDNSLFDCVRHLGFIAQDELKALYKLAAGTVIPSLHEQTSGPFMEAMVLGCPAAAGRIADHEEVAGEGCGLLFDPESEEDIARCLRFLWEHPEDAASMAKKAEKRIRKIRSWRSWANAYNDLYHICASEKLSRSCLY